jgi:hypothetical protein
MVVPAVLVGPQTPLYSTLGSAFLMTRLIFSLPKLVESDRV